jgi:hypothetical protein
MAKQSLADTPTFVPAPANISAIKATIRARRSLYMCICIYMYISYRGLVPRFRCHWPHNLGPCPRGALLSSAEVSVARTLAALSRGSVGCCGPRAGRGRRGVAEGEERDSSKPPLSFGGGIFGPGRSNLGDLVCAASNASQIINR